MRVNEKIEKITEDTLVGGVDIGKTNCCVRFCNYRGMEVYKKVWFDRTKDLNYLGTQISLAMKETGLKDILVSFEPTGHYWLNINKYLRDNGVETVLMPTQTVKQEKGVHDQDNIKSDPKDAILIARLTTEGKYVKPIERNKIYQDIYSGYSIYEDIQKERNRIVNKIHTWNDKYFPELEHVYRIDSAAIRGIYENELIPEDIAKMSDEEFEKIMIENCKQIKRSTIKETKKLASSTSGIEADAYTKKEIKRLYERYLELDKELEEIKEELIELASQIDYVEEIVKIPGVSYISVIGIISQTGDLNNYEHAKQVLKMAGLSLKESSSGQKKGKKHISKRGRAKLRRNLKQTGISLVRSNSFFSQLHTYYTTERQNCLTKLISINAIIRKFTYILMAIVKNKESYNEKKAISESCIFNSL